MTTTKDKHAEVDETAETRTTGLQRIGGSKSDKWNRTIADQVMNALWFSAGADAAEHDKRMAASVAAIVGIEPKDELEGMLAAQLIASHSAAMECYRRAMLSEQTLEGRSMNLAQANKLSRTYTALLEGLNRHRGKGQQRVVVEHVTVHPGGQAIVGNVHSPNPGGGVAEKTRRQPLGLENAPGIAMPCEIEADREAVRSTGNARA